MVEKFIYFLMVVVVCSIMTIALDLRYTNWEYWAILAGMIGSNVVGFIEGRDL